MKSFIVTAFFPEVKPAHIAWQTCTLESTDMALAVLRALRQIRGRDGLKGKRISEARFTIKEAETATEAPHVAV